MNPKGDYPSFEEAEQRFQAFLAEQGISGRLLYVSADDVVLARGHLWIRRRDSAAARTRAQVSYATAVTAQRGVLLSALCQLEDTLCAYVYGPTDADEAERLMYPDGLKLSVPVTLRRATDVGLGRWWYLKCRRRC